MKIYIDSEFLCHVSLAEGLTEIETSFFDDKCDEFIEGYRFVPAGSTWTRDDGTEFAGEMISPWKDYIELAMAQLANISEKMRETPTTQEITTAIEEGVNSI